MKWGSGSSARYVDPQDGRRYLKAHALLVQRGRDPHQLAEFLDTEYDVNQLYPEGSTWQGWEAAYERTHFSKEKRL